MQQDPYQQFASPYVALGGDPVNMVDPSGGWSLSAILGVSRLGVAGVGALVGAFVGGAAGMASGDNNGSAKGAIIGAFAGLSASFMGGGGSAIGQIALQAVISGSKLKVDALLDAAMKPVAPRPPSVTSTGTRGGPNRGNSSTENDEPDDHITVNTKTKTVTVIKTEGC